MQPVEVSTHSQTIASKVIAVLRAFSAISRTLVCSWRRKHSAIMTYVAFTYSLLKCNALFITFIK